MRYVTGELGSNIVQCNRVQEMEEISLTNSSTLESDKGSALVRETAYRGPVGMMRKARWMLRRKVQSTLGSYYVYILAS